MGKTVFRYIFVISFLILIFGFGVESKAFASSLSDTYNVLISHGWSVREALGFLGTSLVGTISMNPSIAPGVAAGALSAYILSKGAQLYNVLLDWRKLKMGYAFLNPVEFSKTLSTKELRNGEYGFSYVSVYVEHKYDSYFYFGLGYREYYNDNGNLKSSFSRYTTGSLTKAQIVNTFNEWLSEYVPQMRDGFGKSIFTSLVSTAHSYLASNDNSSNANFRGKYERQLQPALELNKSVDDYNIRLGYTLDIDPNIISEEGVNFLDDPDAFYDWFHTNYVNGAQGTFITPLDSGYDEFRSDLEEILEKLNNLPLSGGVSEETLDYFKTDIINTIDTNFSGFDSTLTLLQTDISSLSESVGVLADEVNATKEQEQGFFEELLNWLNETLWIKLQEFLVSMYRLLVVPENASEIWDTTVAGWMDMVSWDDVQMPAFSISGDSFGTYYIPLGDGSIPINIGEYVAQTGLRDLITGILVFSMWFGFLLKLLPRFTI